MTLEKHHKHAACMALFQIFTLATIVTVGAIQSSDVHSTYEKQITFVSCNFDSDIGSLKKTIEVLFYGKGDPDTPVTLVHSALFQGKLEYFTHPGFTIIGNVTNTLRLRIDSVTQEHVGRYECHDLPSVPGNYASCNFILKVGDAPGTNTNIDKKDATLLPDISEEGEGIMQYMKPLIITTFSIVLLLLVIGGIILVTVLYKRIKKKTDVLENGSDESMLTKNGSQSEHNHP